MGGGPARPLDARAAALPPVRAPVMSHRAPARQARAPPTSAARAAPPPHQRGKHGPPPPHQRGTGRAPPTSADLQTNRRSFGASASQVKYSRGRSRPWKRGASEKTSSAVRPRGARSDWRAGFGAGPRPRWRAGAGVGLECAAGGGAAAGGGGGGRARREGGPRWLGLRVLVRRAAPGLAPRAPCAPQGLAGPGERPRPPPAPRGEGLERRD